MCFLLLLTPCLTTWSLYIRSLPAVVFYWGTVIHWSHLITVPFRGCWTMNSKRCNRQANATVISNPERIFCDGCPNFVALTAACSIGNMRCACQLWETSLQEVIVPLPRTEGKETFEDLAERPVSKKQPQELGPSKRFHSPDLRILYARISAVVVFLIKKHSCSSSSILYVPRN